MMRCLTATPGLERRRIRSWRMRMRKRRRRTTTMTIPRMRPRRRRKLMTMMRMRKMMSPTRMMMSPTRKVPMCSRVTTTLIWTPRMGMTWMRTMRARMIPTTRTTRIPTTRTRKTTKRVRSTRISALTGTTTRMPWTRRMRRRTPTRDQSPNQSPSANERRRKSPRSLSSTARSRLSGTRLTPHRRPRRTSRSSSCPPRGPHTSGSGTWRFRCPWVRTMRRGRWRNARSRPSRRMTRTSA
mmetsp:Transcript_4168/g.15466  ORF Transcript_4168/g.15466 Transcript_4168/m.15466 type:complete len:240 (-) Transcript_4168:718-1437(-)